MPASIVPEPVPESDVFRGVPSFFRASCFDAARGGSAGYHGAGWNLAIHLDRLLAPGDEHELVAAKLAELESWAGATATCGAEQQEEVDASVLRWFDREFPRCMALVPRRRRGSLLKGVLQAMEEERVFD